MTESLTTAEIAALKALHAPAKQGGTGTAYCPECSSNILDTVELSPCIYALLIADLERQDALLEECRERLKRVKGEVSMIDASPAGSLNASCKLLALDILNTTIVRLNERLEEK